MRLFRHRESLRYAQPGSTATIGGFDGMHRGHQALLAQLHKIAGAAGSATTVVTFEPLPHAFFHRGEAQQLTPLRSRLELLRTANISQVVCLRFDQHLAACSPQRFIDDILLRGLKVRCLLSGDDFRFGKSRGGDFTLLQQIGAARQLRVERMASFTQDGRRVSSTWIRTVLGAGDFPTAARLLGRSYTVAGRVCHGAGRGRQLGFPTANLKVGRHPLPLQGVFVGAVKDLSATAAAVMPCLVNAGYRPTFDGNVYQVDSTRVEFQRQPVRSPPAGTTTEKAARRKALWQPQCVAIVLAARLATGTGVLGAWLITRTR